AWELLAFYCSLSSCFPSFFLRFFSCSPEEIKEVLVSYKKADLRVPYSESTVKLCVEETLNLLSYILKKKEDADFTLKGVGTVAVRGSKVTTSFSEDLLMSLNRSADKKEKSLIVSLLFFWCCLDIP
ncbi:CCD81 protein, partial [Turnix velox]|nr:CCD81 protein [Turnix velox]